MHLDGDPLARLELRAKGAWSFPEIRPLEKAA
jgi:hypothetical protein